MDAVDITNWRTQATASHLLIRTLSSRYAIWDTQHDQSLHEAHETAERCRRWRGLEIFYICSTRAGTRRWLYTRCSTEAGTHGGLITRAGTRALHRKAGGEFGYGCMQLTKETRFSLNSASGQRFCMITVYKERLRSLQKAVPSGYQWACCRAHTREGHTWMKRQG